MALPTIIILGLLASSIPVITCSFGSHASEVSVSVENKTAIVPIGNLAPTGFIMEMSNRGRVIKTFTCPAMYGRYPVPESCEYYFECRFGWPTLWHCNRGYLYDREREQCRDKRHVKCHIGRERDNKDDKDKDIDVKEDRHFKCPYIWGTFAHPYDCSKYYVCVYNNPKLFQCYRNFLYDIHYRKCLPSQRVNCGNRLDRDQMRTSRRPVAVTTTVKPIEITTVFPKNGKFHCPFPYGRYPDPEDCSRFYECRFSIPHLHTCPESTLYHERKEQCLDKKRVKCGLRPGGNDDDVEPEEVNDINFRCPYVWGTFAHPADCSKYIICVYNVPSIFNCRKNELFDARYRRCFPKERVTCDGRINPDDPYPSRKTTASPTSRTLTPSTVKKIPEPTTTSMPITASTTTMSSTTTTPVLTTTTTTPEPTTTTITTTVPTTTTTTPVPTTTTTTPIPTTTTTTTTTTTPLPTTTSTTTTFSSKDTTTSKLPTLQPVTKPNTPPPTDCAEDDLDCIIDDTGDVSGWFDCPKRFGHFPHGSSKRLFIHCDNWRPYVKKCAEHTEFSLIYLICLSTTTTVTTTTTTTPVPTTTTTTPIPTTTTSTTTTTTTPVPTATSTTTTFSSKDTTTSKLPTLQPVTKPNTPPPTDCAEDDLDCIIDDTGDVSGWFDCPKRFGHFPHGSSKRLFIHCDNWRPYVKKCAEHTEFSPIYLICLSTTTTVPTTTTTTPVPTTTTTPVPTTTTTTTTTTTPIPTTTTTTTTTTPVPTTISTTTTTTPAPTTTSTTTTFSSEATTTSKLPTLQPVTKPNTPPPTDCAEDDLDCIIDDTGDVTGWFDCPKRFGHFPHGSSKQLFIHCDNWRPYVKKCAEHTEFSPVYLVCVWDNNRLSVS